MMLFYGCAFLAVLLLTPLVRHYALRTNLVDVPNQRSSHQHTTARGGGIAIVIVWFIGLGLLSYWQLVSRALFITLFAGGSLVALVGYLDDRYQLSARWRVMAHLGAATIAVYSLGGLTQLNLGAWHIHLHELAYPVGIIGTVWAINLYNFMDGIDGLACGEAVFTCLAILLLSSQPSELTYLCTLFAAVNAGFLVWNWPPAKIFMGDISSSLIGFNFAAFLLAGNANQTVPTLVWIILLAVFIADSTYTLARRVWQGEPWYLPHRTHAFQRLLQRGYSHLFVTGTILIFSIVVLLPLAYCAWAYPHLAFPICLLLALGLWIAWYKA